MQTLLWMTVGWMSAGTDANRAAGVMQDTVDVKSSLKVSNLHAKTI